LRKASSIVLGAALFVATAPVFAGIHYKSTTKSEAPPGGTAKLIESLQIQRVDGVRQEVRQVTIGEPIPWRGRQEQRLFRNVATKGRGHATILTHDHDSCRADS
jgi:hypothetical protein